MIITAIFITFSHINLQKTPSAHLNNYYSVKKADNRKDYRLAVLNLQLCLIIFYHCFNCFIVHLFITTTYY